MIVVGRRPGKLVHLDPESVADRLAHESTLPLAVVPHGAAQPLQLLDRGAAPVILVPPPPPSMSEDVA